MKKKQFITRFFFAAAPLLLCCSFYAGGQNLNKPNKKGPLGLTVNTLTGNLFLERNDLYIPARGFNLNMTFSYNSYDYGQNVGFGNGWNFFYNIRYRNDSAGSKTITWGDGREDSYRNSNNLFKGPDGFFDKLAADEWGKLSLTKKDGTIYQFENGTHRGLTRLTEPNGNYLIFQYTDTLLTSITTRAGQTITLNYTKGRLTSLTDAITAPARVFTYSYDAAGNLTGVTDPLRNAFQYSYLVNGPLKTVQDKNKNVVNIVYYNDFGVSELVGCNKRISFSYDVKTLTTYVTDHLENGNQVTQYQYTNTNGFYWLSKVSGNCCGFTAAFEFDAQGNVVKETDAAGNQHVYTYDNKGNILTITNPANSVLTYTYTADYNKVATVKDFKGNLYTLAYDSKGNLVSMTEPGNRVSTAAYNSNGDMISTTDPAGNTYHYNYDDFGNPSVVTGPNGYKATRDYDGRGNLLSYTDARGNVHKAEFDILDRLKKLVDPFDKAVLVSYDAAGNPVSFQNKAGASTGLSWDASSRLVRLRDPAGHQTKFSFDGMDNLTAYENALGNRYTMQYNSRNQQTATSDPVANTTLKSYDQKGNLKTLTMPNGQLLSYTWDQLDRLTKISDGTSELLSATYDENSNIISQVYPNGASIAAAYDGQNRLTKLTDALGHAITFTYDASGNIIATTDRNGLTRNYTYDGMRRVKTYTDNNGAMVEISYDVLGNITGMKDQKNNLTSYTYDNLNRVKKLTYADNKFIQFEYDEKSNIIAKTGTDGKTTTYEVNSLNRIIARTLPDGQKNAYTYNALGQVITATNAAGTVHITYDAANRVTAETFDGRTTRYSYNTAGRTQTTVYPDSTVVVKRFDTRNRLTGITRNNVELVTYQYNNRDRETAKMFANGVSSQLQYDFANRLSVLSTGGGNIQQAVYAYDKEGYKTSISRANNPAASEQFGYDNAYRLVSHKRGIAGGSSTLHNTFQYDAVGNRTAANLTGVATTYSVNNLNQLTSAGGTVFTYDANGNQTFDGAYYKTYDAEGRLLKDSASPSQVFTYQYDAFGRRVVKTENGTPIKFSYSGLAQIEERDGLTNHLRKQTIFRTFLSPVAMERGGNNYYYHQNELHSVEAITNSSGEVVERYQYDTYGKPTVTDAAGNVLPAPASGNRFAFTGQEYNYQTGNYRFHYRQYAPATGTFLQRDPIGYADGMGLYQYVHNNPANGIDVLGLKDCPDPPSAEPPQTAGEWLLYIGNNAVGNTTAITALAWPRLLVNHPVVGVVLTPLSAVSTYNSWSSLEKNWTTNSFAQNVDGVMGTASGVLGTTLGAVTTSVVAGGTAAEMVFGGASLSTALGGGLEAAGGMFSTAGAVTAGGALVATAGGLAIYGLVNEAVRINTGKTLSDHGESWRNPVVEWAHSGSKYDVGNIPFNQYERTENGTSWQVNKKWMDIRDAIERGEYHRTRRQNQPDPDCPKPGGTQRPNPASPGQTGQTHVLASNDPNEIIGPDGVGDNRFVSVNDRLPYTITYENDQSATAPAKYVKIVAPVQVKMDPASFQLGSFGFNNLVFAIPAGSASYYQRVDGRDSLGLLIDVTAGYDQFTNSAFWEFQSIDPVTLLPPSDPLKGFLLLQDSSHTKHGHGFVNFSIKPVSNAVTGDTISAIADIIFDQNALIATNRHKNTIDAVAPTSQLSATAPFLAPQLFQLAWTAEDDKGGSGVATYAVYMSVNGKPYTLYRSGLTQRLLAFTGQKDTSYCFFVAATDSTGNKEGLKNTCELSVVVSNTTLPLTWFDFSGARRDDEALLQWITANESNTQSFVVERSTDGSRFADIGILGAMGNTSLNQYAYTDKGISSHGAPVLYYRIRQVDNGGRYTHSKIVVIRLDKLPAEPLVTTFPNPFGRTLTVQVIPANPQDKTSAIELYTLQGGLLYRKEISRQGTVNRELTDLPLLASGIYLLRTTVNGIRYTTKVVKN